MVASPPDPLNVFKGPTSAGNGRDGKWTDEEEGEVNEGEGK